MRFVTVNTFLTVFDEITWDIHGSKPFTSIEGMRDIVAPMYDQAYSALLEDLDRTRHCWRTRWCAICRNLAARRASIRPAVATIGRNAGPATLPAAACKGAASWDAAMRSAAYRPNVRSTRPRSWPRSIAAWAWTWKPSCPARKGGRSRWSISASTKSKSSSDGGTVLMATGTVENIQGRGQRWRSQRSTAALRRTSLALLAANLSLVCGAANIVHAAESIAILPAEIALAGPEARQQIIVERFQNGQFFGQIADGVQFASDDPQVVAVENGALRPLANGEATITATAAGTTSTAHVVVVDMDKPFAWSFRNHVESVFSKTGCNSGACHGALAGKNGFKLSLRGYDPEGDFSTLTRQARGRRHGSHRSWTQPTSDKTVGRCAPQGRPAFFARLARVSRDFRMDRLGRGRATDRGSACRPPRDFAAWRRAQARRQAAVSRAAPNFTDGHQEDVTRWVKFSSANESVVQIDDVGLVTVVGHGEGVLTAWYASRVAVASVSAPYEKPVAADVFAAAPRRNFIDELSLAKLASLNIPPSPPAGDSEFLRRAFLDTIGVLPTIEETRAFLADTSADKRDKLIEALLAPARVCRLLGLQVVGPAAS